MPAICCGEKPRRLSPSALTLCAAAGWPTVMTYGGTSRVTAALFAAYVFLALARRPAEWRAFFAYHDALMLREDGYILDDGIVARLSPVIARCR